MGLFDFFKKKNEKELVELLKMNYYYPDGSSIVNEEALVKIERIKKLCENFELDKVEYADVYLYIDTALSLKENAKYNNLKKELDMYFKTLESQRNLPKEVYVRFVKTISDAEEAWAEAKAANDYQIFKDHLVAVIKGQKEVLSYVDKNVSDYDYMLDQYQKGMNRERYDIFFNKIKEQKNV